MPSNVAVIGECMLEVSRLPSHETAGNLPAALSYGGDTLNTSVYLARMGVKVDYVTALGDDAMSAWMIDQWKAEHVGCHLVQRHSGAVPGLYMIEVDEHGERSFLYWRENSPATKLFDDEESSEHLFSLLSSFGYIYFSGITLALYQPPALERFLKFLEEFRAQGGQVIFDGNYRPRLWESRDIAAEVYNKVYGLTDIALPTIEDEQMVFGMDTPDAIIDRLLHWGVKETVLKMGGKGCLVATQEMRELVESNKVAVVDTTSAGDSFNAGYFAARIAGQDPVSAAEAGHNLASVVIQHRGAIIPLDAMPSA